MDLLDVGPSSSADENWRKTSRWVRDESLYEVVPLRGADRLRPARLTAAEFRKMIEVGHLVEITEDQVRGGFICFKVLEFDNQGLPKRYRVIKHTKDANDAIPRDALMGFRLPQKNDIRNFVHNGECFCDIDFSAWYDQFALAHGISERFCTFIYDEDGKKRYARLARLAMGYRFACDVAQAATSKIIEFAGAKTFLDGYIDNVISVGKRDDVIHDMGVLFSRCDFVGATINDRASFDADGIAAHVKTRGTWCGVGLDMTNKTTFLADKTIAKARLAWARRSDWTVRDFCAFMGLLWYCVGIIHIPVASYFPLLRYISTLSSRIAMDPSLLLKPADIWSSAWPSLRLWYFTVLENTPFPVPPPGAPDDWKVMVDSSVYGWGYFAVNMRTGEARQHGAPWAAFGTKFMSDFGHRLRESTFAEPRGLLYSALHLLPRNVPARVEFWTDSTVTKYAATKGYSTRSYDLNHAIMRLRECFPATEGFFFNFRHVPGVWNIIADGLSRGKVFSAENPALRAQMLEILSSEALSGDNMEF